METAIPKSYGSPDELRLNKRGVSKLLVTADLRGRVFPKEEEQGSLRTSIGYPEFSDDIEFTLERLKERGVIRQDADPEELKLIAQQVEDRIGPSIFGERASNTDRASRSSLAGEITPTDIGSIVNDTMMLCVTGHLVTQV